MNELRPGRPEGRRRLHPWRRLRARRSEDSIAELWAVVLEAFRVHVNGLGAEKSHTYRVEEMTRGIRRRTVPVAGDSGPEPAARAPVDDRSE